MKANGLATTYQFEYGPTAALGSKSPATPASAGSGTVALAESARLVGLSPDTTYYFELVASNSAGSSNTPAEELQDHWEPGSRSNDGARRQRAPVHRHLGWDDQSQQPGDQLLLPIRGHDRVRLSDSREVGRRQLHADHREL